MQQTCELRTREKNINEQKYEMQFQDLEKNLC